MFRRPIIVFQFSKWQGAYVDTGHVLPSGRKLVVPVTHSHLELSFRGKVSADLEHVAGVTPEAGHRELLERRAMRIRQRLWEGLPKDWDPRYSG